MNKVKLCPRITHIFRLNGKRYLCQFRDQGKDYFTTDCAIDDLDEAMSYTSLIVRFLSQVTEGKVLDNKNDQVIFTCQRLLKDIPAHIRWVREAPPEYAQLALEGLDAVAFRKVEARRKRKVQETFAKLRQLHDELNAQLYARPTERPTIHSPVDAFEILRFFIGDLDHEELWVMNLDIRNRVMGLTALYKGSVNSSQVRVAEVFRQAILDNAPAILLAHNHPSGDCSPSPDDIAVTRSIVQAGKLLDIDTLDHLIIAQGKFTSLKERGLGFN